MNTSNFEWLNNIPTNEAADNRILQRLGLEADNLTTRTSTSGLHGDQDVVKYLFDSAQFLTPMDSAAPPLPTQINSSQSISSYGSSTDDGNPRSPPMTTMTNYTNLTALPVLDGNWITHASNLLPFTPTTTKQPVHNMTTTNTPKTNSSSRKIRIKKKREAIFVTESPQNAYKKKIKKEAPSNTTAYSTSPTNEKDYHQQQQYDHSSSPLLNYEEETIDVSRSLDQQHMTSKERRQLRNKISARNFRVRRKEYIIELENIVDEQEDEIDTLKQDNKRLTDLNQQLVQEVIQLRLQKSSSVQSQHISVQRNYQDAYSLLVSPPNSDTNSPPNIMDTLLEFDIFNSNNNDTYLSYSIMPALDLSAVLGDKVQNSLSISDLKEHRQVMMIYPLLAPTLASIVLRHTFDLHYSAYLTNTFPYNATTRSKNEILDIMHPEDWISAASTPPVVMGDGDEDPNKNRSIERVSSHRIERKADKSPKSVPSSVDQNDSWTEEYERQVLRQHYPYYAFMRLRGFSHDEIIQRYRANMVRRRTTDRQRRLKAAVSSSKLQTLHGFTAVASTLIRNPSRSPMIAGIIRDTKACQIAPISGSSKRKTAFMVASPIYSALRIGGGKA